MKRTPLLVIGLLLFSAACIGQTAPTDTQTLQALLSEVRELHQDLLIANAAVRRAQILVYRLQAQEMTVTRVSQRLAESQERLGSIEGERRHFANEVKRMEEFINDTENSPAQRKEFENRLPQFKSQLETLEGLAQQQLTIQIEAQQQVHAEEAKLADLREQLDRLDKSLDNLGRRADRSTQ